MRWVRFAYEGQVQYGRLAGGQIEPVAGTPFMPAGPAGSPVPLASVKLLAPCQPGKIVCVGINYDAHIRETGRVRAEEPVLFLKPPSSVIGPDETIVRPRQTELLFFEAELAAIIGRRARHITPEQVPAHLLGYTCANDVSARDLQKRDTQWTRGKSFDTFCPLGPWIETDLDPAALPVQSRLGTEVKQDGSTAEMIYPVAELISFISRVMTLEPGDVILTGTPGGAGPMQPGDTITVSIGGIGTLSNPVVQEGERLG